MRGSLNVTLSEAAAVHHGFVKRSRTRLPAAFSPFGVETPTPWYKEASGRQGQGGDDVVLTGRSGRTATAWEARQRSSEDKRKQRDH